MRRLNFITLTLLNIAGVLLVALVAAETRLSVDLARTSSVLQLLLLYVFGIWLMADAATRKVNIGLLGAMFFYGSPPSFFIYYCFRSRGSAGWRLGLLGLAGLLFYLGLAVACGIFLASWDQ